MTRAVSFTFLAFLVATSRLAAQLPEWMPELRGYFLNVPIGMLDGPYSDAGVSDFQRVRVMTHPWFGDFSIDLAYEQLLTLRSDSGTGALVGWASGSTTDWLELQGTIAEGPHVEWRHRMDRVSLGYSTERWEAVVGRQPISWASTLFLTPADPFVPFDPADPFREYRAGVDAARVRAFLGPFTGLDGVVRMATTSAGETITAVARVHTAAGSWELSSWGGIVHEEPAVSGAATVAAAGGVLRGEAVVRWTDEEAVLRAAVGVDRSFVVGGRNLYVVFEYQRDGYGASTAEELVSVLGSVPAQRGELQVFGRDEVAAQASLELSPLVSADALVLWNLNDSSVLLAPGGSYSAGNEVTVRGGVYVGLGTSLTFDDLPGSEYGIVPTTGYVALTWFF